MKRLLSLLVLAMLCNIGAHAQLMASQPSLFDINAELSLANSVQHTVYSPAALSFGTASSFALAEQQQLLSMQSDFNWRKFWGVVLVINGGSGLVAGGSMILMGTLFKKLPDNPEDIDFPEPPLNTLAKDDPAVPDDGDITFGEAKGIVSNVFLIAGIATTVVGAASLTGGILLLKSPGKNGGSSKNVGYTNKNTRNSPASKKNKHKRVSAENLLAPEADNLGWSLAFSASPTMGALTLSF